MDKPIYHRYKLKRVITAAWHNLFPHMQSQLKQLNIKGKTLYIKLHSLILTNDLRTKRETIVARMQEELTQLAQDPNTITNIVFC